jgi:hypothetical protein
MLIPPGLDGGTEADRRMPSFAPDILVRIQLMRRISPL